MNRNTILLSIKPYYAEKIFHGEKTIELRRKLPRNINKGDLVLVYASSPKKMLFGAFTVKKIIQAKPNNLWHKVSKKACIDKKDYDNYFTGSTLAYAIYIDDYWYLEEPISIQELKSTFDSFNIPQSFRYINQDEMSMLYYNFCLDSII